MDQGRQAGRALDAALVSPLPGERGPIAAERARVQLGESVAAAGAAKAHRALVVDEPAAAPGQDGRAVGEARAVLLAPAGGESPDPTPVRGDAAADLGAARAGGLTCSERHGVGLAKNEHRQGEVCEKCPRTRSIQARVAAMCPPLTVSGA